MIEPEAFQLLTLASARDNRAVTPEVAAVWAEDLHDVSAEEGRDALRAHYREKPDVWLMPGHIVEQVKRLRRDRERAARVQAALTPRQREAISHLPNRLLSHEEVMRLPLRDFYAWLDREGLTPMQWAMREVEREKPMGDTALGIDNDRETN